MKLTAEQKLRLKALLALQKEGKISADEATELADLQSKAAAEGYDPEDDTDALTDEQLKGIVGHQLTKTLEEKGLTIEGITKSIKDSMPGATTPEAIAEAVKKSLGDLVDPSALIDKIKGVVPTGLTEEKIKSLFDEFASNFRAGSKMEHPTSSITLPIAHRSGNLSVAQKQLLNIATGKAMNDGITDTQLKTAAVAGQKQLDRVRGVFGSKVLTTGGATTGAELVPTDLSSDLLARLYLASDLAAAFISSEIEMPTPQFQLPLNTTRPSFYLTGEAVDGTASDPGFAQPVLNAKKLVGITQYSYEIDEDGIIAILPMLQNNLVAAAADAIEGAIINGDTTATHQDSDIELVANHAFRIWKGFRKLALAGSLAVDLSTGGVSLTNMKALRKKLAKYGINVNDLLIVAGVNGYNDLMGMDEVLTVDKIGSGATILSGTLPRLMGIPIVCSAQCREDLNASGVFDNTTKTNGSIFIVHKPSFIMGVRRGFTVEFEQNKTKQVNSLIASFRRDFIPVETPGASAPVLAMGYKYTA